MSTSDTVLHFVFPTALNQDMRTFRVNQIHGVSAPPSELYKFYHPKTGLTGGTTGFQRLNEVTNVWENAGEISWFSDFQAKIWFGLEEYTIRELRRKKKSNSKSRRFKVNSTEYKWKIAENDSDLFCVDSKGKTVARWIQDELILRVESRVFDILDRLVVTCFLNLWCKSHNDW